MLPHLSICLYMYTDYKCTYPGCTSVLIIDGNMKNRRDTCAANEAGYLKFEGLPDIKTGCQQTPICQFKYCYKHAPRVKADHPETFHSEEGTQVITSIKQTRNGTYYQVLIYSV